MSWKCSLKKNLALLMLKDSMEPRYKKHWSLLDFSVAPCGLIVEVPIVWCYWLTNVEFIVGRLLVTLLFSVAWLLLFVSNWVCPPHFIPIGKDLNTNLSNNNQPLDAGILPQITKALKDMYPGYTLYCIEVCTLLS